MSSEGPTIGPGFSRCPILPLPLFAAVGAAAAAVAKGYVRSNVQKRHVGAPVPIRQRDKKLGLQERDRAPVHNFVKPTATQNQTKRDERVAIEKLADVVADHVKIVASRGRGRQPNVPAYVPTTSYLSRF